MPDQGWGIITFTGRKRIQHYFRDGHALCNWNLTPALNSEQQLAADPNRQPCCVCRRVLHRLAEEGKKQERG